MKRSEIFTSRFMKAEDLGGQARVLKIIGSKAEELGQPGKKELKALLKFSGEDKMLVLNLTNFDQIADHPWERRHR